MFECKDLPAGGIGLGVKAGDWGLGIEVLYPDVGLRVGATDGLCPPGDGVLDGFWSCLRWRVLRRGGVKE